MLRKLTVLVLFVSLLITQAIICTSRQAAAGNTEMMDLAAMLPDSDVVATMDFDRTLNIAAPSLLNQDAKKIEHLKNLMRTIENQIGISPSEIRQIAFGVKLPAVIDTKAEDFFSKLDFTAIVRTQNPNGSLIDTWSKRLDVIAAFKDEQAPSRRYMDDFRLLRDFKFGDATPEKIAGITQKLQDNLKKTQAIAAKADGLPKATTDAKALLNLKAKNKAVADSINTYLTALKADAEMKALREASIKLLNRSNAVTVDDPQRAAKLAAILRESKDIYPAYLKKYKNAVKIKALANLIEAAPESEAEELSTKIFNSAIDSELDKVSASLGSLPVQRLAKTRELNSSADSLEALSSDLDNKFGSVETEMIPEPPEENSPAKPKSKSFYEALNQARREENVGGKRMIIVDLKKFDDMMSPVETEDKTKTETKSETETESETKPTGEPPLKKEDIPNLAIGFLDDKTMVVGFEKSIPSFLKRDPAYKNQKAVEMLGSAENSLFAFAINSNLFGRFFTDAAKPDKPITGSDIILSKLAKDINIYGSVNYDGAAATNDITMSLGFFRNNVEEIISPDTSTPDAASGADSTFEIAGYQVGKDIFYDLFNSFKAIQASLTFKFDKKKVAGLIRSTPKIIDKISGGSSAPKTETAKKSPTKLKSVEDLLTAPQLYVDLAGLLSSKN